MGVKAKRAANETRPPIPFSKPCPTGEEIKNLAKVVESGKLTGGGEFVHACEARLKALTGAAEVMLTTSCTHALEIAALLSGVGPGDEVIMPSFTFVSTANAFALRGATPVYVDSRADTLNLDETKIEAAITERTKAIVPVHYAGVGCEMDAIGDIAARHGLMVIEDAAQGVCASRKGQPLGTIGALGTFSFHETKNVAAGEGGALLVNDEALLDRALTIREKGTNRRQFLLGAVDKYTWIDVGSAYLPSELMGAYLLAQLDAAEAITDRRRAIWDRYHEAFAPLEDQGRLTRPVVPGGCTHNAHIYYVLLPDTEQRNTVLGALRDAGISGSFHYVPLHTAEGGQRYGRPGGDLSVCESTSARLLRLPLFADLAMDDQDYVIERTTDIVRSL